MAASMAARSASWMAVPKVRCAVVLTVAKRAFETVARMVLSLADLTVAPWAPCSAALWAVTLAELVQTTAEWMVAW
jgi:hypothetical protein